MSKEFCPKCYNIPFVGDGYKNRICKKCGWTGNHTEVEKTMRHIQLAIDIVEADIIDLKITSGSMIGTLHIEKKGLSFSSPNTKKKPEHYIDWNRFDKLIALSNGFTKLNQE